MSARGNAILPQRASRVVGTVLILGAVWAGMTSAHAQSGSVPHGQQLFESRCVGCHSLDTNRVGPALGTVVGRVAGKVSDFDYSPALESATHVWTTVKIKAWLTNPEALVPGQAMGYQVDLASDRDDIVAYLASLNPKSTQSTTQPLLAH